MALNLFRRPVVGPLTLAPTEPKPQEIPAAVAATQKRVEVLTAEAEQLRADLVTLQAQKAAAEKTLDGHYVHAERNATPEAQEAATAAEAERDKLVNLVRRKQVALAAVEGELASTTADLAQAKKYAAADELLAIHAQIGKLANSLDKNIFDMGKWEQIAQLTQQGNQLYLSADLHRGGGFSAKLFKPPAEITGHLFAALQSRVDHAVGLRKQSPVHLTVVGALELPQVGQRIRALKVEKNTATK
mgnify:CR=1 FL=1